MFKSKRAHLRHGKYGDTNFDDYYRSKSIDKVTNKYRLKYDREKHEKEEKELQKTRTLKYKNIKPIKKKTQDIYEINNYFRKDNFSGLQKNIIDLISFFNSSHKTADITSINFLTKFNENLNENNFQLNKNTLPKKISLYNKSHIQKPYKKNNDISQLKKAKTGSSNYIPKTEPNKKNEYKSSIKKYTNLQISKLPIKSEIKDNNKNYKKSNMKIDCNIITKKPKTNEFIVKNICKTPDNRKKKKTKHKIKRKVDGKEQLIEFNNQKKIYEKDSNNTSNIYFKNTMERDRSADNYISRTKKKKIN